MKAQITFRSGAQITFDVTSLVTGRSKIEGELHRLTWESPDDWTTKLHQVDLSEIVAIVCLRDPADATGASDAG
jgi:hypothetical protein